ncbi:MAG: hypothetical protein KJP23_19115, partial [Deltaproteobacteria bacterium]|nr:hypothetical protein [Deltaproteobacteria bacterium]
FHLIPCAFKSIALMKLHESNAIFVKFHTRLQSKDFVLVVILVLVLRPLRNSDFEDEHEDEYEKNQIKAHACALNLPPSTFYPITCSLYQTPVSFVDQTVRFAASGWADTRNLKPQAVSYNKLSDKGP